MNILKNILLGLLLLFTVFFICRCLMALGAVIFDSHIRFRAQQREAFLRPQRDRRYMPLSVLVMAGTEPQALLATLDSLQKQAYPLYEIIVLEDCMKDSDVQALTEQLELLPLPQPGVSVLPAPNAPRISVVPFEDKRMDAWFAGRKPAWGTPGIWALTSPDIPILPASGLECSWMHTAWTRSWDHFSSTATRWPQGGASRKHPAHAPLP